MVKGNKKTNTIVIVIGFLICMLSLSNCTSHSNPNRNRTKTLEIILRDAEVQYWIAEFDKALDNLNRYFNGCKQRQLKPSIRAFTLLPQVYISKNDYLKAMRATRLLLHLVPDFEPNPAKYPSDFVNLVNRLKDDLRSTTKN